MKACYHCNTEWKGEGKPSRHESCTQCDRDIHCCMNCLFYEVDSYNDCREPQAERVADKEKSNFCDYFTFKESSTVNKPSQTDYKQRFDDLFK